jgi:FAD/FMN-containing dehydrogenase
MHQVGLLEKGNVLGMLEDLQAIVGPAYVLTESVDVADYLTDWTGQFSVADVPVVRPRDTKEVAQVVQYCNAHGIAVTPQGGRTGLCGGGVPMDHGPAIVLSLTRLNAIREIDVAARTVVVEAGAILETLHEKTLEHGLVFPLMFGAKGSCTVGGNLSTNAGGSNVVRYGNTRELCLGVEAVMPDGSIINALTGLRKDNTGYDLKNLLIGAEGTLGIITAAVFKLVPQPVTAVTAFLSVASLEAATDVLNLLQDFSGGAVEAFEYMPKDMVATILEQFPDMRAPLAEPAASGILVEIASSRAMDAEPLPDGSTRLVEGVMGVLGDLMERELVLDAMIAQSEQQRADLWSMRESILEAITKSGPAYHFDLSLPLSKVAGFVAEMNVVSADLGFRPVIVGHLGDGNLHYAMTAGQVREWADLPLPQAKEILFDLLAKLNGSFSAEHGIGQSKLDVMADMKEPAQLVVMRAIKAALDPNNIMNPGKFLPEART